MADLNRFHGDLAICRIQSRAGELTRPAVFEFPRHNWLPIFVQHRDRAFPFVFLPVCTFQQPFPDIYITSNSSLKSYVGEFPNARKFSRRFFIIAIAVFNGVDTDLESGHFGK